MSTTKAIVKIQPNIGLEYVILQDETYVNGVHTKSMCQPPINLLITSK